MSPTVKSVTTAVSVITASSSFTVSNAFCNARLNKLIELVNPRKYAVLFLK
jgi:hypothetical protein